MSSICMGCQAGRQSWSSKHGKRMVRICYVHPQTCRLEHNSSRSGKCEAALHGDQGRCCIASVCYTFSISTMHAATVKPREPVQGRARREIQKEKVSGKREDRNPGSTSSLSRSEATLTESFLRGRRRQSVGESSSDSSSPSCSTSDPNKESDTGWCFSWEMGRPAPGI